MGRFSRVSHSPSYRIDKHHPRGYAFGSRRVRQLPSCNWE